MAASTLRLASTREPAAGCCFIVQGQPIRVPARAYTLAGFRAWACSGHSPERGRVSFVGHEIILDTTPEEYESHGQVKAEISSVIYGLIVRRRLGKFFADRTLLTHEAGDWSSEPDAAFATWKSFRTGRIRLVPHGGQPDRYMEIEGTPDWVLEVVSNSSVQKDTQQLLQAYHQAGIREYWLVDARSEQIDFRVLWHQPAGYVRASVRSGWQKSRVFRQSFQLVRRRDRLGLWQYTLRAHPR